MCPTTQKSFKNFLQKNTKISQLLFYEQKKIKKNIWCINIKISGGQKVYSLVE